MILRTQMAYALSCNNSPFSIHSGVTAQLCTPVSPPFTSLCLPGIPSGFAKQLSPTYTSDLIVNYC